MVNCKIILGEYLKIKKKIPENFPGLKKEKSISKHKT